MPTPKIQVEDGSPIDGAEVIKLVAGTGLTAVQTANDEKAIITLNVDTTDTDALGARVTALEADGSVLTRRISFTETAAAGVYTGTVALPAGAILHSVAWETSVAWGADTTTLDLGYTGTLTAYGNDINVDGTGGDQVFGLDTEDPDDFPAGTNFVAELTTTGAGTTAGRTAVTIEYSVPPTATAATKVAS